MDALASSTKKAIERIGIRMRFFFLLGCVLIESAIYNVAEWYKDFNDMAILGVALFAALLWDICDLVIRIREKEK